MAITRVVSLSDFVAGLKVILITISVEQTLREGRE